MSLLADQDVPVAVAVPYGEPVHGAIMTGPARIGNMNVVGDIQLPGSFTITGKRYSVVNKVLQPGECYQGEPGVMMYMSPEVKMRARFAGLRVFSGEGLAKNKFVNTSSTEVGYLGLTPNMPMAIIMPFQVGNGPGLNCKRGSFMAGDESVKVHPKILPARSCMACCCGGMPPLIQKVEGEGVALLNAGGTVVSRQLAAGEKLIVDTDSVVAFTDGVGYDVKTVGSCLTCCLGGEGCFNTEMTGPGVVYLQTLSYEKLIKLLVKPQANGGKKKGGEEGGGGGEGGPVASAEMDR